MTSSDDVAGRLHRRGARLPAREQRAQFPLLPYALVQALQGQTLPLAMVDNPVGLAAWVLEKHHAWTPLENGQDPDEVFDVDRLITTVMVYALTGTFHSSTLIYAGLFGDPDQLNDGQRVTVPTTFADVADPSCRLHRGPLSRSLPPRPLE